MHCSLPRVLPGAGFLKASAMVYVAVTKAIRTSVRGTNLFFPLSVKTSSVTTLVMLSVPS